MEIDYAIIRSTFDPLKIRDTRSFIFLDTPFTVWFGKLLKEDYEEQKQIMFYSASTVNDGFDIYIPTQLRVAFRKPAVIHEAVEALVYRAVCGEAEIKEITYEEDAENKRHAHAIAKACDERYARETLPQREYENFMSMKQSLEQALLTGNQSTGNHKRFRDIISLIR